MRFAALLIEALTVKTQDADPHGWAEICNHLGISYANRLCGEQDKNLERAIEYHQDALEVLTSETDAESWVASQQ
jgi:hypothetical protein